jgi:hypothetical protein
MESKELEETAISFKINYSPEYKLEESIPLSCAPHEWKTKSNDDQIEEITAGIEKMRDNINIFLTKIINDTSEIKQPPNKQKKIEIHEKTDQNLA